MIKRFIASFIPQKIKMRNINSRVKKKYDVIFEKGATAGRNTIFEGLNLLKINSSVFSCYIGLGTYISGNTKLNKAQIGRFCSIGQNVRNGFGIHPTDWVSSHPCFYSTQKQAGFTFVDNTIFQEHKYIDKENKYYIRIGNDVWIGNNVQIMDGVTIGDGAIVATGAIVNKDVEPYSIVGGIPAKNIRKRFCEKDIAKLIKIAWWDKDVVWLKENAKYFNSIDKLIEYGIV